MNKFEKTLESISLDKINLIVFIIGLLLLFAGVFINPNATITILTLSCNDIRTILISIASSLIASSIIAYLSSRYLVKQNKMKEIIDKWGLEGIYETRAEMNESSNKYLSSIENEMDIIALGMRSFRDAKGDIIKEKVKKGIKIRILTLEPNSMFVTQREKEEDRVEGEIKKTISDLAKWINDLKDIAPDRNNIELRFYNTCPLDSYMRIDGHIYIGPNLYGIISQQTISFEFKENSTGYSYYCDYFNKLWNDNNFSKEATA